MQPLAVRVMVSVTVFSGAPTMILLTDPVLNGLAGLQSG